LWGSRRVVKHLLLPAQVSRQFAEEIKVVLPSEEDDLVVIVICKLAEVVECIGFSPPLVFLRTLAVRNVILRRQEIGSYQTPAGGQYEDLIKAESINHLVVGRVVIELIGRI
jgi:hypothetical protein